MTQQTTPDPIRPTAGNSPALATLGVEVSLGGAGRALASTRQRHLVVDSPPPLGGPNEAWNPLELLLSALASCAVFVCEAAAREAGVPLAAAEARAEGDFDPRGVRAGGSGGGSGGASGGGVDPRLRAFRVTLRLRGPDREQAAALAAAFQQRCPVYATLARAAEVRVEVEALDAAEGAATG